MKSQETNPVCWLQSWMSRRQFYSPSSLRKMPLLVKAQATSTVSTQENSPCTFYFIMPLFFVIINSAILFSVISYLYFLYLYFFRVLFIVLFRFYRIFLVIFCLNFLFSAFTPSLLVLPIVRCQLGSSLFFSMTFLKFVKTLVVTFVCICSFSSRRAT